MNDNNKRALAIVSAMIACLAIIVFSLKDIQLDPPPLDKWEAPVNVVRPWAEDEFNQAIHPIVFSNGNTPLVSTCKIKSTSNEIIDFTYTKTDSISRPSKVIHLKPDELFENLYVSILDTYVSDDEHTAKVDTLYPEQGMPLSKEQQSFLEWNAINGLHYDYTGLPRIAYHTHKDYRHLKLKKWQIYDQRTHVKVADSRDVRSEIALLHPAPVVVVADLMDDTVISATLAKKGMITHIGDFQCKLITSLYRTRTWNANSSPQNNEVHCYHKFTDDPEPAKRYSYHYVEWSDPNFTRFSSLKITTNDGVIHPVKLHREMGHIAVYCSKIKPTEIKSIEISTQPYFTRYITNLDELPGMPEANRGVTNLFNIKIPTYFQSNDLSRPPFGLANLTQLQEPPQSGYTYLRKPTNYGETSVREMITKWEKMHTHCWFQVHQSTMSYQFHQKAKPQPQTYGQKYLPEWLR